MPNVDGQPGPGVVEQFWLGEPMFEMAEPTICHCDWVQVATTLQLWTGFEPYSHSRPAVMHEPPEAGGSEGQDGASPLSPPLLPMPLLPLLPLLPVLPLLPLLPVLPPLLLELLPPLPLPLVLPLPVPPLPLPAPLLELPLPPPPPSVSPLENVAPPQATGRAKSGTMSTIPLKARFMERLRAKAVPCAYAREMQT